MEDADVALFLQVQPNLEEILGEYCNINNNSLLPFPVPEKID